jgi:hypothetical protein
LIQLTIALDFGAGEEQAGKQVMQTLLIQSNKTADSKFLARHSRGPQCVNGTYPLTFGTLSRGKVRNYSRMHLQVILRHTEPRSEEMIAA